MATFAASPTQSAMAQESLNRAVSSQSVMNYQGIFDGFLAMGIPEAEIKPRENVFTFWAWKALGRRVMKGQHGVEACTFVPVGESTDKETGEKKAGFRMPRTTTVFHVSQTEPDPQGPGLALADDSDDAPVVEVRPYIRVHVDSVGVKSYADAQLVNRFRNWADAMQPKIDHAFRDMTQNPTPKRNREYQSRRHDGRNMERMQKALRVLADLHADESVPESLAGLRTRDEIGKLVRKYIDGSKGGYYSCIESDDYAEKSPLAHTLQGMIEGNSAQRTELERVRKIGALQAEIALSMIPGYFPTQPSVTQRMFDLGRIGSGTSYLEPSAGSGHIADAIRAEFPAANIEACEINPKLRELLTLKGYTLVADDFLEWSTDRQYDRIIMNPPFEKQADIDHVRKAYGLLADDGVLVSVMAPGFEFSHDRKSVEFRQWLHDVNATVEDLPDGSFKASGTGVSTKLVVIDMAR